MSKNPETVKRISQKLLAMGIDTVLELAGKPKSPSRQLGHSFKRWLRRLDYPFLGESEFRVYDEIAFLEGSDKKQNTIFTVELPFVKTNEELERVKEIYSKYDPYFIISSCSKEQREKFDKLWENYQSYADKHFLSQIKVNFHQKAWEIYVGNALLKNGLTCK